MLLSDALGVTSTTLLRLGVYDSPIGFDLRMHVDPARLRSTRVPELLGSYKKFQSYFSDLAVLIQGATPGSVLERQSKQGLRFPETKQAALGYAKESNEGRGVGPVMAAQLYKSAKEIVTAGEKNPAIFELAVLFEPKFGPDSLSDMTIKILLPELLKFNERIAKKLNLPMKKSRVHGRLVKLVHSKRQDMSVLLIPHSILAKLPLATDWSEIDDVVAYNRSVREQINQEVSKALGDRITDPTKPEIRDVLLKNSPILRELLKRYGKAKATPYDFEKDPLGLMSWYRTMRQLAEKNPLKLDRPKTTEEVYQLVRTVCDQFKHQVEENEIAGLLFNDNGTPKQESASQKLFYALADSHCVANDIDISREPETGRGPADFKLSRGHKERVFVELKLSTNGKYLSGLTAQLPTYLKAQKAKHGILLLLKVDANDRRVRTITRLHAKLTKAGKRVPELVVIDAIKKASASKLKGLVFDV